MQVFEPNNPKIINLYLNLVCQIETPRIWKVIRFLLHWLTLPIKLALIATNSLFCIILLAIIQKSNISLFKPRPREIKQKLFKTVFKNLPVWETEINQTYVNRVPVGEEINGKNHNTDHQAARHGVYAFIMNKLERHSEKIDSALMKHIADKYAVIRGYKIEKNKQIANTDRISGDQLLGICLALSDYSYSEMENGVIGYTSLEKFDIMINDIIDNDYALGDLRNDSIWYKSCRGMFQPGLETTGAQAITILAALSLGKKFNIPRAKKHYNKLIWLYGYGLLSLFPTTFWPSKRNYSNDNNCMIAAYILAKTSKNKISRLYWTFVMLYVWSLSWQWYNGFFTGLLNEIAPSLIGTRYLENCKNYLYSMSSSNAVTISSGQYKETKTNHVPVRLENMHVGEFLPDEEQRFIQNVGQYYKTGLGWIASVVMLDTKEAKEFLNEEG